MESIYDSFYKRKSVIAYPEIPSVHEESLVKELPSRTVQYENLSPILSDPRIEK